jgi:hypothetical protein
LRPINFFSIHPNENSSISLSLSREAAIRRSASEKVTAGRFCVQSEASFIGELVFLENETQHLIP